MKLKVLLTAVGIAQIILGIAYLLFPAQLLAWMGHSLPPHDLYYPFGMLAARFLAYGAAMLYIVRDPARHTLWINNMILIQTVDLLVGLYYTWSGVVPLILSRLPMFNALIIIALLWLWYPKAENGSLARRVQ